MPFAVLFLSHAHLVRQELLRGLVDSLLQRKMFEWYQKSSHRAQYSSGNWNRTSMGMEAAGCTHCAPKMPSHGTWHPHTAVMWCHLVVRGTSGRPRGRKKGGFSPKLPGFGGGNWGERERQLRAPTLNAACDGLIAGRLAVPRTPDREAGT